MKQAIALYFIFCLLAIGTVGSQPTSTPLQGRIDTGTDKGAREIRFALPEFQPKSGDPATVKLITLFNQVLWNDLDYSGNITLVNRSFYPLGRFQNESDIRVDDWTKPAVNAQFMAFGNAEIKGGELLVQAHLWDLGVVQNRELGKQFGSGGLTEDSVRNVAHTFADYIVDTLFNGKFGISRTKIAYVVTTNVATNTKEIFFMDYDGANPQQLTTYRTTSFLPTWSPDGEKLAFITYRHRGAVNLEIMSTIDRRPYPFASVGPGTIGSPAWSPDGSQIAFFSSREGNSEIYVADWNGRNLKRLTVSPKSIDVSPTWSRTGRQLAFVSDRSGSQQIYIMDVEGTNPQRIINEGGDTAYPAWSPDGQRIVFSWLRPGSGRYDLYVHELATGKNIQLTRNQGTNERPTWAPDGRHLAFYSDRTGSSQIYTMLVSNEKVRQLTKTGINEGPAWSTYIGK